MNGPRLDLELDARDLRRLRLLANVSRMMAAKALTFTAEKAVAPWRAANAVFHQRREWINKGVRFRPATPSTMAAQVGTIDKYMGRHVVGIGEEKESAGRALFVPTLPAAQQGTHTQTRRKLKGMQRTRRKPFVIESGGKTLLVRRKGKRRNPLEVLAMLTQGVDIPERLDALGVVGGVVRREFPPIYERLLIRWADKGRT